MVQSIVDFITASAPPQLAVFLLSMLPISELRGALIVASALGIPWAQAVLISVVGNVIPVPFILLFIRRILAWLGKTRLFGKIARYYEQRGRRKGEEMGEKYPRSIQLALFVFVAIPLPMTGAWTGSLAAAFLGIPFRRALPPIVFGVLGAAAVMSVLAYAFPALLFG